MNWFVKIMTSVAAPFVSVLLGIILVGAGLSLWVHPGLDGIGWYLAGRSR